MIPYEDSPRTGFQSIKEWLADIYRQGGLVCCDSWGCKESDVTE